MSTDITPTPSPEYLAVHATALALYLERLPKDVNGASAFARAFARTGQSIPTDAHFCWFMLHGEL